MKKTTLKSATAYTMIRDGILSGVFLPGTRLVLVDLEKKLGLGRGPVRDALMRLDRSGLIENIPFKGAIVKVPPTLQEMEYIYHTRFAIEEKAIIVSMNKATKQQINMLQKLVDVSWTEIDIPQRFFYHDRKFHATMYEITGMSHILDIINTLNEHINIFLNTHNYDYAYREESFRHHQQMIDAMREKNAEKLADALKRNMTIGLEYIQKQLFGKN